MKPASLSGSLRENVGKKDAVSLRKSGEIPGVLYGDGNQTHFSVNEIKLSKIVVNPDVFIIDIDLDGTVNKCIIQEVQFHPVTDRIVHIDLLKVMEGKPIKVNIPLRSQGTAEGVVAGGRMVTLFRRVPVKGLIKDLPDALNADVSTLNIGDGLRVRDLNSEGCEILLDDSVLLFACRRTRAAMSLETEGEGLEGEEGVEGEEGAAEGGGSSAEGSGE